MTCKHCGASISEYDEKCPYCDSYIDHGPRNNRATMPNRQGFKIQGPDEPQAILMVVSFLIPFIGIILGVIYLTGGNPKSGRMYIIIGAISMVVSFGCVFLGPMLFMLPFFHSMK
ncbi:MAG: hypothetical protein J6X85_01290 [Ruminococcus sp.]|nr:hypothetical protein [Ruminococcus sp.]